MYHAQHKAPPQAAPQPYYDQPWPPVTAFQGKPPQKRRRVFLWVFLAVQVLFVFWVVSGAASAGDIHSQAVAYCHAHPDQFLPFAQCVSDYGTGSKAGTAIGVGLVVVLWTVTDIILGVSYGVYRLARRG